MYSTISQLHAAGFVEIINDTYGDKYSVNNSSINISQKRKNDFEDYIPTKIEKKIKLKSNGKSLGEKTKDLCDNENGEIESRSKNTVLKDNGFKSKIKSKNDKINTKEPNTEISEGYIIGGKNRFYEKPKKVGRKKLRS